MGGISSGITHRGRSRFLNAFNQITKHKFYVLRTLSIPRSAARAH